jgi:hypothetical protein
MNLKALALLIALLLALVLLVGGRNLGLGVNTPPLPAPGLAVVSLGLIIWCAGVRLARSLSFFRTFLIVSYIALMVFAVQSFARGHDDLGGLNDASLDGLSKNHLQATVIFSFGFSLLSLFSILGLYLLTRQRDKTQSDSHPE